MSALSREHGDHYNLEFLYWYESAYKQDYYCKYRKAFFKQHGRPDRPEFDELAGYYRDALNDYDGVKRELKDVKDMLGGMVERLAKSECTALLTEEQQLAEDTIHKIDSQLGAMIELDEGTWNFEVNLCKLSELQGGKRNVTDKELNSARPAAQGSLLERAVCELKFGKEKCR